MRSALQGAFPETEYLDRQVSGASVIRDLPDGVSYMGLGAPQAAVKAQLFAPWT
jgi:hypothetical protein